jgi:hypothetical protein
MRRIDVFYLGTLCLFSGLGESAKADFNGAHEPNIAAGQGSALESGASAFY